MLLTMCAKMCVRMRKGQRPVTMENVSTLRVVWLRDASTAALQALFRTFTRPRPELSHLRTLREVAPCQSSSEFVQQHSISPPYNFVMRITFDSPCHHSLFLLFMYTSLLVLCCLSALAIAMYIYSYVHFRNFEANKHVIKISTTHAAWRGSASAQA